MTENGLCCGTGRPFVGITFSPGSAFRPKGGAERSTLDITAPIGTKRASAPAGNWSSVERASVAGYFGSAGLTSFAVRDVTGRMLLIILPISVFVALGFERSIAGIVVSTEMMPNGASALLSACMIVDPVNLALGTIVGGTSWVGRADRFCSGRKSTVADSCCGRDFGLAAQLGPKDARLTVFHLL